MKKHILHILPIILALLSCQRETDSYVKEDGEGIVLRFLCTNPSSKDGTDGTRPGEGNWNEDLISTLDLFYYPENGTGSDCVLHERFSPNEPDGDVTVTTYTTDEFVSGSLVPTSTKAFWVYAIANYPGTIISDESVLTNTSVADLKQLAISCNFAAASGHKQDSFVMDGLAHVTDVTPDNRLVAKGLVYLLRAAAKITVKLNIAEQISVRKTRYVDDNPIEYDELWEPMTSGLQLYIENAVSNTTVAAKPVDNPVYFNYKDNRLYFSKSNAQGDADYPWLTHPTYVYPQRWEYASKDSPTIEPTLKLILPWRRLSDEENGVTTTQKQFYYKIIIPDDPREATEDQVFLKNFVRNNWYNFNIDIGMLGSETDEAAVAAEGSYYVLDWQDKDVVVKQAVIGKARFLSIEPKEHVLSNVPDVDMIYTSSHPVALNTTKGGTTLDITATKIYYGDKTAGTSYGGGTIRTADANNQDYPSGQKYIEYNATQRAAINNGQDWLKVQGDYVKFYHELQNVYTAGEYYDTAPYIVRFNLYHADHKNDAVYKQSVKIIQYPAIYIEKDENSDFKESGSTTSNIGNHKGYVYIDNQQMSGNENWQVVRGLGGNNKNYNMYIIHVTVLDDTSTYIIGDSRDSEINNLSYSFASTVALYGTSPRRLTYYYPTSTDPEATNMIAPSYRVASSYGVCGNAITSDNAKNRCAAYQEDGFPMGRWRVPSRAEVEFITTLSSRGIIPTLFNVDGSYWCATGVVSPQQDGTLNTVNTTTAFVRCVYDDWYWGDETVNKSTPTWGDKPM